VLLNKESDRTLVHLPLTLLYKAMQASHSASYLQPKLLLLPNGLLDFRNFS